MSVLYTSRSTNYYAPSSDGESACELNTAATAQQVQDGLQTEAGWGWYNVA